MPAIYAQADALLLTLIDDPLIAQTVPSKLQSYLAAGVPIVAAVNGEAGAIVRAAGAGIACPANDAQALADAIRALKDTPPGERAPMGARACSLYASAYTPPLHSPPLLALVTQRAAALPAGHLP